MVLAAGAGSRLQPWTDTLPKTLLAVDGDRSILDVTLANLKHVGLEEAVIVTGYASERVAERVPALERRYAQVALLLRSQPATVDVARLLDAVHEVGLLHALVEGMRAARTELAALRQADQ